MVVLLPEQLFAFFKFCCGLSGERIVATYFNELDLALSNCVRRRW